MKKRLGFCLLLAVLVTGCTGDKPERIEADEDLPTSPCACGPRVTPLLWMEPA